MTDKSENKEVWTGVPLKDPVPGSKPGAIIGVKAIDGQVSFDIPQNISFKDVFSALSEAFARAGIRFATGSASGMNATAKEIKSALEEQGITGNISEFSKSAPTAGEAKTLSELLKR